MRRQAHLGTLSWNRWLGDEATEQDRMLTGEARSIGPAGRSNFVGDLKTELSVATVKGNAPTVLC